MIRTGRHLLALTAVLVASGCGGGSSQNPFTAGVRSVNTAPHVEVTNNNWLDAVVYATRLGTRVRIGQVTSLSQRLLRVPAGFARGDGRIALQVTLIGSSEGFQTGQLFVAADEIIVLDIQNDLSISSWAVFSR